MNYDNDRQLLNQTEEHKFTMVYRNPHKEISILSPDTDYLTTILTTDKYEDDNKTRYTVHVIVLGMDTTGELKKKEKVWIIAETKLNLDFVPNNTYIDAVITALLKLANHDYTCNDIPF